MPDAIKRGAWLRNGDVLEVNQVVEFAVEAEHRGWDGIFVSDELERFSDPWTVLAAVAARTDRIKLGTWITPIPNKQPWRLAYSVASLDRLSGGRVILGTGLGAPWEHDVIGGSPRGAALGRKYDEALDVITRLWTGQKVSHEGEFFTLAEAQLRVTPIQQPRVPILVAGWWPNRKPFQRAARWDGVMPYWPALRATGEGPQGERQTGSVTEELRDLMAYYVGLRDQPGEVVLPDRSDDGYRTLCAELGATWLLSMDITTLDDVRNGPPS